MDFGTGLLSQGELPDINAGDLIVRNDPSPAATFRKMYPKLRDRDVHLFELGTYSYQWVDGWRTDVWFKKATWKLSKIETITTRDGCDTCTRKKGKNKG